MVSADVASTSEHAQPARRPLALVAEDNVTLRENAVRTLRRRGVAAIAVGSFSQAASALTDQPRIDVALLDIHLDLDKDTDDRGGVAIARLIRSSPFAPKIIGYSGKFREGALSQTDLQLFDNTEAKGALNHADHLRLWNLCVEYAKRNYAQRRDELLRHQEQLRRLYESELSPADVIRRLQADDGHLGGYTAEGALGLAGYRVKLIHLSSSEPECSRPAVLVWEQSLEEGEKPWVNLEVYGQPALYATGPSEEAAIESLATFFDHTLADINAIASPSDEDETLRRFITRFMTWPNNV